MAGLGSKIKLALIKERCILCQSALEQSVVLRSISLPIYKWQQQTEPPVSYIRQERTNQQEDKDGNNHHEGSVSIEGNSLDDTRFEDFIPPRFQRRKNKHKCTESKNLKFVKNMDIQHWYISHKCFQLMAGWEERVKSSLDAYAASLCWGTFASVSCTIDCNSLLLDQWVRFMQGLLDPK